MLTGDCQYFKLGGGVFRQDPSHLENDITQYMWHGVIWLMASSFIICCCLPLSTHFASIWANHPQTKHTLGWSPWNLHIIHRSCNLGPTCGTCHHGGNVENVVEETDNRDPKGDKVPLGDNRGATHGKLCLRSLVWLGLMYPPFWFSMLKYKKATLILLEGNIEDHSEGLVISSELSTNDFHTGFHYMQYRGPH